MNTAITILGIIVILWLCLEGLYIITEYKLEKQIHEEENKDNVNDTGQD